MDVDVGSPPAPNLRHYNPFSPNLEHEEKQWRVIEVTLNVLVLSKTRLEVWILIKQIIIHFVSRKTYWYELQKSVNPSYKLDTNKLYSHIQYKT